MHLRYIPTLTLLGLAACGSPAEPTLASSVAIAPTNTWAGSTVRVTAVAFRRGANGAVLHFGTETLPLTRLDDTTLAATLPTTMSGTFTPRLEAQGQTIDLSPVTIGGYMEAFTLPPVLAWDVLVWPRDGRANVMGPSPDGVTILHLDTRTVTSFDSIIDTNLLRGPGVTYEDGVFLLRPRNSATLESWRILPTPVRVAVHDMGSTRQSMRLGPNAWFGSSAHSYSTAIRADSSQPYVGTQVQAEETEGVLMSPRHDRATIQVDAAYDGVPVFDVPSGQVAYLVTAIHGAMGVDFSPDGAVLAMAGGVEYALRPPSRVQLLDASSGAVLQDTTLADGGAFAIAVDPNRPLVYVGLSVRDSPGDPAFPSILVLDRDTFAPLGRLDVPRDIPDCTSDCYKGVIALSDATGIYVAWGYNAITETRVYRFSYPD